MHMEEIPIQIVRAKEFEPTYDWAPVEHNHVLPAGLEARGVLLKSRGVTQRAVTTVTTKTAFFLFVRCNRSLGYNTNFHKSVLCAVRRARRVS